MASSVPPPARRSDVTRERLTYKTIAFCHVGAGRLVYEILLRLLTW